MTQNIPFSGKELLGIKKQIVFFVFSAIFSAGIYLGSEHLNDEAARDLRNSRTVFQKARSSVELIEEEEATIIEYIDEYKLMAEEGIVKNEDRLQFLEDMAVIREELSLFPINLNIDEQYSANLEYPPDFGSPGAPIELGSSAVSLSLPLLHEEDFTRLLTALDNSPGLYQITECDLTLRNTSATSFTTLQQHMSVSCEILWYTYNLQPSTNNGLNALGGGYL